MSTIDIRLPENLMTYLEAESAQRGYTSVSEFVQALLEADKQRHLKREVEKMLLESIDGPFSTWTNKDLDDIRHAGKRLLQGRKAR
jgi:Arc/MetJ-type ribon-helix-helix transcriptional regulator